VGDSLPFSTSSLTRFIAASGTRLKHGRSCSRVQTPLELYPSSMRYLMFSQNSRKLLMLTLYRRILPGSQSITLGVPLPKLSFASSHCQSLKSTTLSTPTLALVGARFLMGLKLLGCVSIEWTFKHGLSVCPSLIRTEKGILRSSFWQVIYISVVVSTNTSSLALLATTLEQAPKADGIPYGQD